VHIDKAEDGLYSAYVGAQNGEQLAVKIGEGLAELRELGAQSRPPACSYVHSLKRPGMPTVCTSRTQSLSRTRFVGRIVGGTRADIYAFVSNEETSRAGQRG